MGAKSVAGLRDFAAAGLASMLLKKDFEGATAQL
jgi:hypothetical protein